MQGRVTIDFGNSNPHAGVFIRKDFGWKFIKAVPWSELPLFLAQLQLNPHNTSMVLASVRDRDEDIHRLLEQGYLITKLRDYWRGKSFAGMKVSYGDSLGEDRLIEAFYCFKNHPLPTLIIDAGTFVTVDLVTADGFRGGYILPGKKTYLEIFSRGHQLAPFSPAFECTDELPQETAAALGRGYLAFTHLVLQLVGDHGIKKIVITGGHGEEWRDALAPRLPKLAIEVNPDLIHFALQHWMDTQIEPI